MSELPPNTHDPETGAELMSAERIREVNETIGDASSPEEAAERLGMTIDAVAQMFHAQIAHIKQVTESLAGIGQPVRPNRRARRLLAGKGPKRMRHGMMADGHVQTGLKKGPR